MKEEDAIKRIEEQIGKSHTIDYDPAPTLLNKCQKELAELRKEGNFDNKIFYKDYPPDAIPPWLYSILNKNRNRVINLYTFVQKAKKWEICQEKVQVTYAVENLYPSVTVDKAISVSIHTLNNDKEHLKSSTQN